MAATKTISRVRARILAVLSKGNKPLDAGYLTEKLQVNKTSVYRELDELVRSGMVTEVDFGEGKKRYEPADLKHHHHLICTKCNSVDDVELEQDLTQEEKRIEKGKHFKIIRHSLEFFGVCKNCR